MAKKRYEPSEKDYEAFGHYASQRLTLKECAEYMGVKSIATVRALFTELGCRIYRQELRNFGQDLEYRMLLNSLRKKEQRIKNLKTICTQWRVAFYLSILGGVALYLFAIFTT